MALTRSFLKALGIDEEKIGEIINAHSETVTALKAEAEKYKADAEKLSDVQKQLDAAKDALKAADSDGYKAKYEAEKAAHEKLKADTAAEKTRTAKESALREALKAAGYSEAGIKKIVKYGGFVDSAELDGDKLKDGEKLLKSVAEEWGEYKGTQETKKSEPATPPTDTGSKPVDEQAKLAAEIAAQFHADRYGAAQKPDKEGNKS